MKNYMLGAFVALSLILGVANGRQASADVMAYSITGDGSNRLYSVNVTTGASAFIGSLGVSGDIEAMAIDPTSGELYAYADGGGGLYKVSTVTGAASLIGGGGSPFNNSGMAFDDSGQGYVVGPTSLSSFDKTTGSTSQIGFTGRGFSGLAFVGDTLYASPDNGQTDRIHTLNTTTGASTPLAGPLGITSRNQTGLSYDAASDTLYLLNETTDSFYSINRTTGLATFVSRHSSFLNFEGFAIIPTAVSVVPEPSSLAIFAMGALGMIFRRRRE